MKTAKGLVEWAENAHRSGWVYWYGTYCNPCTKSRLSGKTKQYPDHYKSSRQSTYKKHIEQGKTCTDCVGLIKGYYWELDGSIKYKRDGLPDTSASGMYRAAKVKGEIGSMPEVPGLLVWTKNKSHIGVYVGDGYVVEARGFSYGVQRNKLTSRGFVYWGYCPYIDYGAVKNETAAETGTSAAIKKEGETVVVELNVLRNGDEGKQVRSLQQLLAANGYECGKADGTFGIKTLAAVKKFQLEKGLTIDGVVGAKTWAKLLK